MASVNALIVEGFPSDSKYWLVFSYGKIFKTGNGSFEIEVILIETTQPENDSFADYFTRVHSYHIIRINLASIKFFHIGSIWHKKKLYRNLLEYRNIERKLFLRNPSLGKSGTLGQIGLSERYWFPDECKDIPVRYFKKGLDYEHNNFDYLIFPCHTIAKYYFFKSDHLIHHVVAGNIEPGNNEVFNPDKSDLFKDENNLNVAVIWLGRKTDNIDAYKAARMAFDSFYLKSARQIYANRIDKGTPDFGSYIDTEFPIESKTYVDVRGRVIILPQGEKKTRFLLVHSIVKCHSKPPFDIVKIASDRDNRGAEITNETKQKDGPPIIINVPVEKNVSTDSLTDNDKYGDLNLKNNPSSKNTEAVIVNVADDEVDNFDPQNISPIDKDYQKYLTKRRVKFSFFESTDLTGSNEGSGSGKLPQAKFRDDLESLDRFNDVFEELDKLLKSIDSKFKDRIVVDYVAPFPFNGVNYVGFSVFPIEKFRKSSQLYNWCHLTMRRRNQWFNPRRVRIVELCIDTVLYAYLIEVERKVKQESTLLYLRDSSYGRIGKDQFKQLLYECVLDKGSWRKVKNRLLEPFYLVPIKHTKPESILKRVLELLER